MLKEVRWHKGSKLLKNQVKDQLTDASLDASRNRK